MRVLCRLPSTAACAWHAHFAGQMCRAGIAGATGWQQSADAAVRKTCPDPLHNAAALQARLQAALRLEQLGDARAMLPDLRRALHGCGRAAPCHAFCVNAVRRCTRAPADALCVFSSARTIITCQLLDNYHFRPRAEGAARRLHARCNVCRIWAGASSGQGDEQRRREVAVHGLLLHALVQAASGHLGALSPGDEMLGCKLAPILDEAEGLLRGLEVRRHVSARRLLDGGPLCRNVLLVAQRTWHVQRPL